jgi:predicted ATPase with chaperone activity
VVGEKIIGIDKLNTVNLAPADVKKEGVGFDLPILEGDVVS